MSICKGQVVSIAYVLKDDDDNLIDQGDKDSPLVYLHGHNGLIPGVEEALEGKSAGDSLEIVVPPEKGYGQRDENLDLIVEKSQFPEEQHDQLAPGVQFQGPHPEKEGEAVVYTVHQVQEDKVYVSGNNPLAGMNLNFAIEVVDVRDASAEELEHGHVHGPGGHHH